MKKNYYASVVQDLAGIAERSKKSVEPEYKRIAVDIPIEMHNTIKAHAAFKNIKFREYVLRALTKELALDKDLGY